MASRRASSQALERFECGDSCGVRGLERDGRLLGQVGPKLANDGCQHRAHIFQVVDGEPGEGLDGLVEV